MMITIGWWVLPVAVTLCCVVWAFWPQRETGYGADIVGAFHLMGAIIATLAAWLVWALLRP